MFQRVHYSTYLLAIAVSIGCLVVFITGNNQAKLIQARNNERAQLDRVTPVPVAPRVVDVHSPDGTMHCVMKRETNPQGMYVYSFHTVDASGVEHPIYEAIVPTTEEFTIPPNSWSPDHAYVFIIRRDSRDFSPFVFRADGSPFADGQPYIDISSEFKEKVPSLTLRDVTGWDDPGLLHVFTYNPDNTKGPSYWFEVYDQAFIQLANR